MSLRWERFAGDTGDFAVRLSLYDDPHPLRGADADTSASWGAIQIWIDGVNICAHTDQGETLTAAHWYLLPLLEWLVASWDPLLHEERLPLGRFTTAADFATNPTVDFDVEGHWGREERRYEWDQRHSLRVAADGGLLPDLRIRRLRDQIEFSWTRTPVAGVFDVEWQAPSGHFYTDPKATAQVLHEVVSEAAKQLSALRPESPRIHKLVDAVGGLQTDTRTEVRTAWLAGLGTTATTAARRWRAVIDRVREGATTEAVRASFDPVSTDDLVISGSCQAALLFGSTSPTLTDEDAYALAARLLDAYTPDPTSGLDRLVRDEPLDDAVQPWAQGYDLAEDLLEDAPGLLEDSAVNIEGFLKAHEVSIDDVDLADRGVRAVSFAGSHHLATMLINTSWDGNQRSSVRRFTMAHELCHLLHDRTYGAQLAVASGPWAPFALEQRANAFAAMLLMPQALLRRIDSALPLNQATRESLAPVATRLGVTLSSLVEHLCNVGIIDEVARTRLRLVDHY